ncbi:MAG TPA: C4-type zinc ribbon domain-containing protein [Acidimicrobiales bacterium]|nr:C4-type zinc ribbon domain-containing protein [Acidimicrobiales bacterium]
MSSEDLRALMDADRWLERLAGQRATLLERVELARVEGDLRERLGALRTAEAALEPLARAYDEASAESSRLRERRDRLASRLEASRDARESAALAGELDQLRGALGMAEDRELEALVEVEPAAEAAATLRREAQPLAARRAELIAAVAALEASLDEEVAAQRLAREAAASKVEGALRARYEAALARAGGAGAAQVLEGRCDGCRLALSPLEFDRWRHAPAGEYPECPSCGRLLLP